MQKIWRRYIEVLDLALRDQGSKQEFIVKQKIRDFTDGF